MREFFIVSPNVVEFRKGEKISIIVLICGV